MHLVALQAALCSLIVALAGCSTPYTPPQELPAEYTSCNVAADCEAVEVGCCDECNGGTAYAVASDQVDAVREAYSEECGAGMACTEMGCSDWILSCTAGTCTMARDQL